MVRRERSERVLTLSLSLKLEAFVDVLGDSRSVSGFEQVHVAHCALGGLASATDVILGSHALEVDVPAVELAGCDDELGICGSCCFDCGGNVCCDVLG